MPTLVRPVVTTLKSLIASSFVLNTLFPVLRQPSILRRWAAIAYANPDAITNELLEILAAPAQDQGSARAFAGVFRATIGINCSLSVKTLLPTLKIPMLLIWGQKDRLVPPVLASQFAQYNENLQLLYLKNVGHCPHDESPEIINQAILDWINKSFPSNSVSLL